MPVAVDSQSALSSTVEGFCCDSFVPSAPSGSCPRDMLSEDQVTATKSLRDGTNSPLCIQSLALAARVSHCIRFVAVGLEIISTLVEVQPFNLEKI